ncbi:ankyrin repeat-containing domain protein [Cladochytrium replicatum]|nr:ankyrin repeat-containing domain protein [Cladochytrium replicatum]
MDFDTEEFVLCSRYGELDDMQALVAHYLESQNIPTYSPSLPATLRDLFTRKSPSGHTALHMASANGHLDIVKYLLQHMTLGDVNMGNNTDNSTALHWAAVNGHLEVVEVLLSAGADATQKNSLGRSAVTVAEQQEHREVANILLKSFEVAEDDEREQVGDAEADDVADELQAAQLNGEAQ